MIGLLKIARAAASRTRYLRPRLRSPYAPSFPVPSNAARAISIVWPSQYEWPDARGWVGGIHGALGRRFQVRSGALPQGTGCVAFAVKHHDRERLVVIDYHDHADKINDDLLAGAAVYFKMHFRGDGYSDPRIVPGGFVNGHPQIARLLRATRRVRDNMTPRYQVYGRFGLTFQREIRSRAISLLSSDSRFAFEGGVKKVRYPEFLEECARSSVCIDLPSNSDFCFRFIDYLAIGVPVVAWPHRTKMHVPLEEGRHVVYCSEDLGDIGDKCHFLLRNPAEARRIGLEAREYYDRFLHPDQLASYYITTYLDRNA